MTGYDLLVPGPPAADDEQVVAVHALPPPVSSPLNEASRHVGGAEERRPRLQHERYRDRRHELRESSLVAKRGDERPVGELRADLRGDPPADEDTPHRQRLEGEVARLGAVDRDEEVERLDAERVATRQADL